MSVLYWSGNLTQEAVKECIRPDLSYDITVEDRILTKVPYEEVMDRIRSEGWENKTGSLQMRVQTTPEDVFSACGIQYRDEPTPIDEEVEVK